MRSEKFEGFILKRSNFGEADKIITVFSRPYGKIKLLAKGIRRIKSRRAPHLELFSISEIVIHRGNSIPIVTEARLQGLTLQSNLKTIGHLFYVAEVLDKLLPEEQPHPEIYESICKCDFSETETKKFIIETLWNLGFLPRGDFPKQSISDFVESIIEKPLKSKRFLDEI